MPDATARYVIAADDRTKAALASALRSFKGFDTGVRTVISRLNTVLGVFAGVGLAQLNTAILRGAEGNKEFAAQLERVRAATRNLVSGGDLTAAIAALERLEQKLRDPGTAKAIQNWSAMWVTAWANIKASAAETVVILDEVSRRMTRGAHFEAASHGPGKAALAERGLNARLGIYRDEAGDLHTAAGDRATRQFSVMREFEQNSKWLDDFAKDSEEMDKQRKEALADLDKAVKKSYDENAKLIEGQIDSEFEQRQALYDWRRDEEAKQQQEQIAAIKDTIDQTVQFWAQGSQRTARSFLQAMLTAFANRALQNAIDELFKLESGGGGLVAGKSLLSKALELFGGMIGFQHGGSFRVGGSGGPDSKLVAFRASPGERVTVTPQGHGAGGLVFAPVYNIDARGSQMTEAQFGAVLARSQDITIARMRDLKRRGQF